MYLNQTAQPITTIDTTDREFTIENVHTKTHKNTHTQGNTVKMINE